MKSKPKKHPPVPHHPRPGEHPLPPEPGEGHPRPPAPHKHPEPPAPPPPHHDIPPHVFHEIMAMKEEIGKLKGKIEAIENILFKKGGDK